MRTDSLLEVAAVSRTGRVVTAERTAASGFMAPLHAHAADEAIHVVEGRLTVFAGADVVTLEAGETFVVAERVAHTFRVGPSGARIVFSTFAASASRYDGFLRATGPVTVGPSGSAVWAGVEDARAVVAVAAAANVSVYGPPGMLPARAETAVRAA
jgi:mannose-6-phosphate isomerase-like protein (cupin superfamily)